MAPFLVQFGNRIEQEDHQKIVKKYEILQKWEGPILKSTYIQDIFKLKRLNSLNSGQDFALRYFCLGCVNKKDFTSRNFEALTTPKTKYKLPGGVSACVLEFKILNCKYLY